MNEKPHTHEIEFYRNWDRIFKYASSRMREEDIDPSRAKGIKYGDQNRKWPRRTLFKYRDPKRLEEARIKLIQEIVATHDHQSVVAGVRAHNGKTLFNNYNEIAQTQPWKS